MCDDVGLYCDSAKNDAFTEALHNVTFFNELLVSAGWEGELCNKIKTKNANGKKPYPEVQAAKKENKPPKCTAAKSTGGHTCDKAGKKKQLLCYCSAGSVGDEDQNLESDTTDAGIGGVFVFVLIVVLILVLAAILMAAFWYVMSRSKLYATQSSGDIQTK